MYWGSQKLDTIAHVFRRYEKGKTYLGLCKTVLRELFDHFPLDIQCYVDNKGVVDAVHSAHAVDDKLTRISIAIIQEHLEKKEIVEVNHIPGEDMIVDPLTKQGASTNLLLEVLKSGVIPPKSIRK